MGGNNTLGAILYFFGSFFSWGAADSAEDRVDFKPDENYVPYRETNLRDGWLFNPRSECSNVSDFFLYTTYRIKDDKTPCEKFVKMEVENFYDILIEKSDFDKSSKRRLQKLIGKPVLIPIEQKEDRCDVEIYIQFPGGKHELQKKL
ncbi:MAG: hypothetical protein SFU98_16770 [Leptospiraceae bacterium]|nr:hypothetical protein [Leptospiraceae bacterium]